MKRSTVSRVLSPESAVALIAGFAIAAIDINWIVRSLFVGIAVVLVAYVFWTVGGPIWRRITFTLVGSTCLIGLSWKAIQHDLARDRAYDLLEKLQSWVPVLG
jgi:membrane protein implicated in regulation of membrane protease activity